MADNKNAAQKIHEQLGVTKEIKLKEPVTLGDGTVIETITARAVMISDIRAVADVDNEVLRELKVFSRITGLVPEDLDLLGYSAYRELQGMFR